MSKIKSGLFFSGTRCRHLERCILQVIVDVVVFTDCLWYVACHDGILAWWDGLLPSLVLVFNPAINFMVYEALKRNILPTLALWVR